MKQALSSFPTIALLFLSWLFTSNPAFAGGNSVGNGGGAWVCRNLDDSIRWSELVDLFEAQRQFGWTIENYQGPADTIVNEAVAKLSNAVPWNMFGALTTFVADTNYLKESPPHVIYQDAPLQVIDDSLYLLVPKRSSCFLGRVRYEQVVNYHDDGTILVERQLFNSLPDISKAALILHEAIYTMQRSGGDKDSINTRKMVGLAFSTLSTQLLENELITVFLTPSSSISSGPYQIILSRVDRHGNVRPMPKVEVQMTGTLFDSSTYIVSQGLAEGTTDGRGIAQIMVSGKSTSGNWVGLEDPKLTLNIAGKSYVGPLNVWGWASALRSSEMPQPYWCEAGFLEVRNDGRPVGIEITCTETQ